MAFNGNFMCTSFKTELLTGTHKDRKSTRLNSSHRCISYAVFCLKIKTCTEPVSTPSIVCELVVANVTAVPSLYYINSAWNSRCIFF